MHLPQMIIIGLQFLGLGFTVANEGKPRPPYDTIQTAIAVLISQLILAWGGWYG